MRIRVITIGLLDIAFKPMDSEIHLAQPDSFGTAFYPVDADVSVVSILLMVTNELCALNKHPTGTAGRIKDSSVKGLDNFNDEFDEGGGREEFTTALSFAHSEIAEKVLIHLPESIALNVHRNLFHNTEKFKERVLFKAVVSLR